MIRGKRNDAYGRQTLRVDCCGWESYREAVSYIIRHIWNFGKFVIVSMWLNRVLKELQAIVIVICVWAHGAKTGAQR